MCIKCGLYLNEEFVDGSVSLASRVGMVKLRAEPVGTCSNLVSVCVCRCSLPRMGNNVRISESDLSSVGQIEGTV